MSKSKYQLKVKEYPEFLGPSAITIFWPGDPACDPEKSDLDKWAKSGCVEGLVAKPKAELTPILVRRLTVGELAALDMLVRENLERGAYEAARIGLLKIGDSVIPRYRDRRLLDAISEEKIEPFFVHDDWKAEIPALTLISDVYRSMGIETTVETDGLLQRASLGVAAGLVVLARSFRPR